MNPPRPIPRLIAWASTAALAAMPALCWDPPTCTMKEPPSETLGDGTRLLGHLCSDWQWVGPNGVVHRFPGTSSRIIRMKVANRWQMVPVNGDVASSTEVVNLTSVQASDGAPIFLSTTDGTVGSVITTSAIYPKYKVLSVIYAPPGNGSSVTYGSGSSIGTSTTVSKAFSWELGLRAGLGSSAFLGLGHAKSVSSTNALAITCTESASKSWYGASDGIDHDQDVLEIWLNPAVNYTFTHQGEGTWSLVNHPGDPVTAQIGADVVTLTVGQLMGRAPITNEYLLARLRRDWPGGGALTGPGEGTDFHDIAKQNPFHAQQSDFSANAFLPDPGRFTLARCAKVNYAPRQGPLQMSAYSVGKETVKSQSRTFSKSYTVSAGGGFGLTDSIGLTASGSMTWTDSVEDRESQGVTCNAQLSVAQPPGDWQGPAEVVVYTDDLYGTFLFTYLK